VSDVLSDYRINVCRIWLRRWYRCIRCLCRRS